MAQHIVDFISNTFNNPHWVTFFLAMLPITELRVALPWGWTIGNLSWAAAFGWAVAGNFLISIPILLLLEPVSTWLMRYRWGDRFFNWLFARTRRKGKLIETAEFWGLVVFVGIPLPVTGAWTGCVAAFLFGMKYPKALLAIFLGLLMSASIVSIAVYSGMAAFRFF